ncbi:MAG: type II toxin-antitoxin system Phd/YefM family antitoxin [bacterium]
MKNNSHTIHSLDELKASPKKVLTKLQRSGKPILLTDNGQPEFMMIDVRKLYKKIGAPGLQRLLEEAEADIAAGRVEDFDQFMKRFRDAHNL